MIPVLLIVIPLVTGLIGFMIKNAGTARSWALLSSLVTLAVSLWGLGVAKDSPLLHSDVAWLPELEDPGPIQPVRRFVQDQQFGITEQARRDPQALA